MSDGKGCKCGAYGSCECGCPDVDWTPQEVYDLRAKLKKVETKLLEMPVVIYPKGELQKKIEELESRLKESLRVGYKCEHIAKNEIGGDCVHCNLVVAENAVKKLQKDVAILRAPLEKIVDAKYARDSALQCLTAQLNEKEQRLSHLMDVAGRMNSALQASLHWALTDVKAKPIYPERQVRESIAEWDGMKRLKESA